MSANLIDRLNGVLSSVAIKAPVKAATTANVTLAGEQTIDGVSLLAGDRVLVKNQASASENGVYVVDTSSWDRASDFDGNRDIVKGTFVRVVSGTENANKAYGVTSSDPITIGTSPITFGNAVLSSASSISFLQSGTGAVEREANAKMAESVSTLDTDCLGDGTDETTAFQAALTRAAGGILRILKPQTKFVISEPLVVPSDTVIVCDPGVVIETAASSFGTGDAIFYLDQVENVTIHGNGAILRGLREGTGTDLISMGVSILGSTNIRVFDVACEDMSGDGFYIAGASDNSLMYSQNVWLVRPRTEDCMRQGLSIVGARDLWVVDYKFNGTNGKSPGAGIDIEPDPTAVLYNINILNGTCAANEGFGYQIELNNIVGDIDITLRGCKAIGGRSTVNSGGFRIGDSKSTLATGRGVLLDDCEAADIYSYGLLAYNISRLAAPVNIRNFRAVNTNTGQVSTVGGVSFADTPVGLFTIDHASYASPGNVHIDGLYIHDETVDRTPFALQSNGATKHNNVSIRNIRWVNSVGTTSIPYLDDSVTNCTVSFADGPIKWARYTNITLTARYNGIHFHNTGDTNGVVYTLPAVAAGLAFTFECVAAQSLRITPNASDRLHPYASADAKYMETSTPGSFATIKANPGGTDWIVQRFGTWTDEP